MARALSALQQYGIVTANYWAFTLTDSALRILVVFHFHELGYSTLEIAFLFLCYEFFGIITNLYGGWLGARFGLRLTLWSGTLMQVAALLMLIPVADTWPKWWSVAYVMVAQAISGIAKDLNKMSAKSAIKTVVPETPDDHSQGESQLFKWVAILTGSKTPSRAWASSSAACCVPRVVAGALLSLRCPRCVVRGGLAGVSAVRPGLALLGGGRLHGPVGDQLRHRAGSRTGPAPQLGPECTAWCECGGVLECPAHGDPSSDCHRPVA
jgi:MFS family permease